MNELAQFHFLRPYWLLALLPLALSVWLLVKKKLGSRSWEAICDESLLPYILIGNRGRTQRAAMVLIGTGGLLALLSLAGPVWNKLPQPVFSTQTALVIALDMSRSMDASDISPSRLARARFKITDILHLRREGQTALLIYAGDAFTVTPLTDDAATITSQLTALATDIIPVPGNRTDLALSLAGELLQQAGSRRGDILLITDEVDPARSDDQARALRDHGYRVSVMGIGTAHGAPVPLRDGSFLKDRNGEIVIPMLDEGPLRELAAQGGGRYVKMAMDDADIAALNRVFTFDGYHDDATATELETDVWREQGPWLLLLLIPLATLAFRRGYLLLLLCVCLPMPQPAQALEWSDVWLRADQRAGRALAAGEAHKAAELFKDPAWKGAAQYRAGDYEAAAKSLEPITGIENLYNKGNALARAGHYPEAIAAYDQVLKQSPDHADAKYNKELVEKELQQQDQKPPFGQDQKQDQEQGQKQDSGEPQQDQDGDRQQPAENQEQSTPGQQQPDQQGQNDRQNDAADAGEQRPKPEQSGQQEKPTQVENSSPPAAEGGDKPAQEEPQRENAMAGTDQAQPDEKQQATEQWLRRIPDDPAGLLRRKFLYQYQQRAGEPPSGEKTW